MGINPVAFSGADMGCLCFKTCSSCPELWYQYEWQTPAGYLSREALAWALQDAERDIENFLRVPLCPKLKCKTLSYLPHCEPVYERLMDGPIWPNRIIAYPYERDWKKRPAYDLNDCPLFFLPRLNERLLCEVCRPDDIVIVDTEGNIYENDGNHCPRWAQIVVCKDAPGESDADFWAGELKACEIELRHTNGQILPGKHRVEISFDTEANQYTIVIKIDVWKLIKPELWEFAGPVAQILDNACQATSISLLDPENLVECLGIWRKFHDPSLPVVEFCWEPGTSCGCLRDSCEICNPKCVAGCVTPSTRGEGFVLAHPATWDNEKGKWCADNQCLQCARDPDFVRFYYWHGYVPNDQCPVSNICEVDCSTIERIVAILAASRLINKICSCECERQGWWTVLQRDTSYQSREAGSYFANWLTISNPFGSRVGEIETYRKLDTIKRNLCGGYMTSTAV